MAMLATGGMISAEEKYGSGSGAPQVVNNITQNCGCCGGCGGGGGVSNHEQLSGLLGGDGTGHYHLTKEEYEAVLALIEEAPEPEWTEFDGGTAGTTEAEYAANRAHWLDGGDAAGGQTGDLNGGEA